MALSSFDISDTSGIRLTKDAFVIIVRTEWNAHVVDILEAGCIETLIKSSVKHKIITVPGAFEIPFAIKSYWASLEENENTRPDAFIALGAVIRGNTPHFEYVCNAVTDGVVQLNLSLPVPTIFGILTVNTQEQADERTGGAHGHKGKEAAITALKMIALVQSFQE